MNLATKRGIKVFSSVKIRHEEINSSSPLCKGIGLELSHSQLVGQLLEDLIGDSAQEYVYACYLDCHLEMIGIAQIALGSSTEALVSGKAVFQHALLCNAENVIIGHNHPTGNLNFSNNDVRTFHRLEKAGELLGIKVLDFLAVSDNNYRSMQECQHAQLDQTASPSPFWERGMLFVLNKNYLVSQ